PQKATDDPEDHSLFLGVCSNYLCNLRPGDEIKITGPNGKRFLLPTNPADHDYLFIAAGTGIAPFRGMALELLENSAGPCKSQIHLIMGSPYTTDLLYDDLFRRLADEHENFHYHTAISREPRSGGRRGIYVHHLIDENIDVFRPLLAGPRTLMYICGLLGMQNGIYQVLVKHGVDEGYLTIGEELRNIDPSQWEDKQVRRHAKATPRCMVEVY
ncbi:MAG: ferredoxin reductase domain-containing protein, partial [Planctomycetota bacterium]